MDNVQECEKQDCPKLQQLRKSIEDLVAELERAIYPEFFRFETRKVITKMLLLAGRNKYDTATTLRHVNSPETTEENNGSL